MSAGVLLRVSFSFLLKEAQASRCVLHDGFQHAAKLTTSFCSPLHTNCSLLEMKCCCSLRAPVGRLRLNDNTEMLLGSWWCCAALADQTGEEYINIYLISLGLAENEMHVCFLVIRCGATSGG